MDVIIEARIDVSMFVKNGESFRSSEIFELNDHVGEVLVHLPHEDLDELFSRLVVNSTFADSDVKRIRETRFVVGTEIEANREGI